MNDQRPEDRDGPETGRATPAARMPLLIVLVVAAGSGVLAESLWVLLSQPFSVAFVVLLTLTVASGWLTLRVPSMPISFSISDAFTTLTTLVVGPAAGAVTAAIDGFILSFRMQSSARTMPRVLFNMAAPAIATWTAAQVFFLLANGTVFGTGALRMPRLFGMLAVFATVNFVLGTSLVAAAVALERRLGALAIWRQHFVGLWVTHLGGLFAAMLMLVLSGDLGRQPLNLFETLLLIGPLPVILYYTFSHALGRAQDQIDHLGGMNQVYLATIEALAQTIDAKDQVTHDHIRRVQDNSVRLAARIGVHDEREIQALKAASLLHDVGKISTPEHILNKPGRLTPAELEIMRRHAPVGADILSVIGFPFPVVPIVRHHHENWDGSGYPDGLRGDAIPIGARILSVVDCFDALTSDRPYRPRLDPADALKLLVDRRGSMYDPQVVDAFVALQMEGLNDLPPSGRPPVADPHAMPLPSAEVKTSEVALPAQLAAFAGLGGELADTRTFADVGAALWRHLGSTLGAASFVLFAYDEKSDALLPAFHAGLPVVDASTRVAVGERLSGWVAATRQAVVNSDARLDVDPELRETSTLQSALAVPLGDGDRVTGVIAFYADRAQAFTPVHQRMLDAAAGLVCSTVREHAIVPVLVPRSVS